jgi:hypothetical protein
MGTKGHLIQQTRVVTDYARGKCERKEIKIAFIRFRPTGAAIGDNTNGGRAWK